MMTPEGIVESYLVKKAKQNNMICFKFVSPGNRGVPDRILIGNGKTIFIETKADGKKPRKLQEKVISKMRNTGATVFVADNKEKIDEIINMVLED